MNKVKPEKAGKEQYPAIDMKRFGINLREASDARKVTATDLKRYLNLGSIQAVYMWFGGKRLPTVDNLYAISQYLGVSMDSLFVNPDKKEELCLLSQNSLSVQGNRTLLYWTHLQKKK